MNLKDRYKILSGWGEVSLFTVLACGMVAASFKYPEIFNILNAHGSTKLKLSLQMSGIWINFISTMMIAIRIIRSSHIEKMTGTYIELRKELSEKAKKLQEGPHTTETIKELFELPQRKEEIESHFHPIIHFGKTERIVIIAGLCMYVIGSIFQLVSAG